jgi:hypothetical protein
MSALSSEYHPTFDPFICLQEDVEQKDGGRFFSIASDYVQRLKSYDYPSSDLASDIKARLIRCETFDVDALTSQAGFVGVVMGLNAASSQTLSHSYIGNEVDSAIAELHSLRSLSHGWDGYEGFPPSGRAISDAVAFLTKIRRFAPKPVVSASAEGHIELIWDSGSKFANLGFEGIGKLDCYAEKRSPAGQVVQELILDDIDFAIASADIDDIYQWIVLDK